MSQRLTDLLESMRQHPGFRELVDAVPRPQIKPFRLPQAGEAVRQEAEWKFVSGRQRQHDIWREFLESGIPPRAEVKPSDH